MGRVGICGSLNMDVFSYVERLPQPGETLRGRSLLYAPGGKGANQAVAAARASADVSFTGARGRDGFGEALVASLRADGIDVADLREVDEPTGVALILVQDGGENQIVVVSGANDRACGPALDTDVAVWVTQAEVPVDAVIATLEMARA